METTTAFLRRNPSGHTEFLVDKAKAGSETAWREFYRRYHKMLVVLIRSRIPGFARRRFDAEDVLQDAFSKAWLQIQSFEYQDEGSFRQWLRRLMLNEFSNRLRSHDAECNYVTTESQAGDLSLKEDLEAKTLAEDALSQATLLEQMGKLEDEDHDIITMRMFEGFSFEEIGRSLGCGDEKAKSLYLLALKRLERRMH